MVVVVVVLLLPELALGEEVLELEPESDLSALAGAEAVDTAEGAVEAAAADVVAADEDCDTGAASDESPSQAVRAHESDSATSEVTALTRSLMLLLFEKVFV